jgi:hypothetical protein
MNRAFELFRGLFKRYRKRGAIALAIIVAIELIAATAVVIGGRELLGAGTAKATSEARGTPAAGFSASHSAPSIAVF